MKLREMQVGNQRIEEFSRPPRHLASSGPGTNHLDSIRINGRYAIWDMTFDEAVLRATNGEQLEPSPF